MVHGDKELTEKLGRNDLCPCGSNRRFQKMLSAKENEIQSTFSFERASFLSQKFSRRSAIKDFKFKPKFEV